MARRSVLLAVALVIALVGTALIVLYVQGIDKRATAGQELVEVLAATDTIEAGESVAAAMEAGKFEERQVRREDVVDGALSSTGSISDLVALGTVYAGEQVIAPKFGTMSDTEGLLIPDDKVAISVELSDPARVAGFVNPGSDVAIFLSADPVRKLPDGTEQTLPPYTRLLLPKVQVIGVGTSSISSTTTTTDEGEQVVEQVPRAILTLAVDQKQAEKVIFAARNAEISFALLSGDSKIDDGPGVSAADLMPEIFRTAS
ncbi:Flp pilus assembly protein CpaB [Nocardioides sp. zg-1228]|uniref:Flp pilus assembly protein CpaB n=1 Tax=Nocardioides sp. zg-1228 TaxID=2763008 RepID=UPI001643126C|nr:Flp pilus assembly protein CpaB [Nocardioides sp. zg-1228]MBC2933479.1 Flp pilus assembly protein CpaB [Nocardioides sp. zg-1228]QSF56382.1 Flp pilus assembly protein CpaB [Nocardioides sp. zg-1228]